MTIDARLPTQIIESNGISYKITKTIKNDVAFVRCEPENAKLSEMIKKQIEADHHLIEAQRARK